MEVINAGPIYKLKDERYFLALCSQNAAPGCFDMYFVNNSDEEIKSLRMRIVEYCCKVNIMESEQQSYVEDWFYSIPPKGHVLMTAISIDDDKPGEYISSFEIMTGSEKVIAECTMYKESLLTASFNKIIAVIEKTGKRISLESRTFSK